MLTETRHSRDHTALAGPIAIAVFLLLALIEREMFVTSIALLALLLYVATCIWGSRVARKLEVERTVPDHLFHGEEACIEVRIRNGSRLPIPWLRFTDNVVHPLGSASTPTGLIHLGGRKEYVFRYPIRPRTRGSHRVGPLTVTLGDPLGLEDRWISIPEPETIVVYPRIVPLHELGLPTRSPLAAVPSRVSLMEDASRVVGVREYQDGDSLRRIHWAASAAAGRPLVKRFQPAVGRPTLLCLDLNPDHYICSGWEATERAIVVAASLAHHIILREGQPVGLVAQGGASFGETEALSLRPASTHSHLLVLLDRLAYLRMQRGGGLSHALGNAIARMPAGSSIICIGGRIDERLAQTMFEARRYGHAAFIITTETADWSGTPSMMTGIPVFRACGDSDLEAL